MAMNITTALLPVNPQIDISFRSDEERSMGMYGRRKERQDFVFLGYGPRRDNDTYDSSGKPSPPRLNTGSLVNIVV
jgi:hypothetical protein